MSPAGFNLRDSRDEVAAVAVCGDWHGNTAWAQYAIYRASSLGADVVVQAGDFGYGFDNGRYVNEVSRTAMETGVPVLFVDGNHENFDKLLELPVREDGLREVAPGVFHLPRGLVWEWKGVRWLAAGGGYSVDKPWRVEGESWWPQETINDEELEAVMNVGKVDVLVSHDTDGDHEIPGTHRTAANFREDQIAISEQHRKRLTWITEATEPELAFHGHYHVAYEAQTGSTRVIGLGKDGHTWNMPDHMKIVRGLEVS